VAHGALFGIVGGTLVSLVGSMGGAALGFAVGRWGSSSLHRWMPADERRRADELLRRWGDLAVIVARPVPIPWEPIRRRLIRRWLALLRGGQFLVSAPKGRQHKAWRREPQEREIPQIPKALKGRQQRFSQRSAAALSGLWRC
jgi:hypothetical protein